MTELTAKDIRNLVGSSPLMVECGANDGTDTQRFLDAMPGIRLYCFEPDPRAIRRFKATIHDDRCTLIEAAVSDIDGEAIFHGSSGQAPESSRTPNAPACVFLKDWDLSGSLCKPTGHLSYSPWVSFPADREYTVQTVTLDTWLDEHFDLRVIDFIWCDTQGGEGLVVRGGVEMLRKTRWFYCETYANPLYEGQPTTKDFLALIEKLLPEYKFVSQHGDNILCKNTAMV
mgnify:CR=1 FL=1